MANSWALRGRLRSPPRNRFFASCCVIVEPPTTLARARGRPTRRFRRLSRRRAALVLSRASACWLRSQAFSSASHSTPLCSAKPASSEAMTARFRCAEIALVVDPLLAPGDARACSSAAARPRSAGRSSTADRRSPSRDAQRGRTSCSAAAAAAADEQGRAAAPIPSAADSGAPSPSAGAAGEHRRGLGLRRARSERLGRLFDQHAEAVAAAGAMGCGPVEEACGRPVHHVDRERAGRQHPPATGTAPPCRLLALALTTTSKRAAVVQRARAHVDAAARPARRGARPAPTARSTRAVGDHDLGRPRLQQRSEHAGRRAAGADQQHALARAARRRRCARCRAPGRCRRCCRRASPRRRSAACWRPARAPRARCPARRAANASNLNGT